VQEDNRWFRARHVMVDRNDVDAIRSQHLQHWRHLRRQHRDVTGNDGG
jgi:hypothetical protein